MDRPLGGSLAASRQPSSQPSELHDLPAAVTHDDHANGSTVAALEVASDKQPLGGHASAAAAVLHDEAQKVKGEHVVVARDDTTAKPVGYFSLYRCGVGGVCGTAANCSPPTNTVEPADAGLTILCASQVCRPHRLAADGTRHNRRRVQRRRHACVFDSLWQPVSGRGGVWSVASSGVRVCMGGVAHLLCPPPSIHNAG